MEWNPASARIIVAGVNSKGKNIHLLHPKPTPQQMTVCLEDHTLILAYDPVHLQGIQDYAPRRDT